MEYCGNSLQKTMITRYNFSQQIESYIYKWLLNTAKGLQCMHSAKYAHLDIKPANIVIDTQTQESKLIDFGLTFNFSQPDYRLPFAGTMNFISPEMILDIHNVKSVEKCDVYSLGISFIECAFAFHYRETYRICRARNLEVMDSVFRHVPTIKEIQSQSQSQSLQQVLKLLVVERDDNNALRINRVDYNTNYIVYETTITDKPDTLKYTVGDLYKDVLNIHAKYPIFRKMIVRNPNDRCTIQTIIDECLSKVSY